MPEDFLPTDDIGQLQVSLLANEGTSYTRMVADSLYVQKIISADPNVYLTNPRKLRGAAGLGSSERIHRPDPDLPQAQKRARPFRRRNSP